MLRCRATFISQDIIYSVNLAKEMSPTNFSFFRNFLFFPTFFTIPMNDLWTWNAVTSFSVISFFFFFFFFLLSIAYTGGKLLKSFSPFCISIMKSYCRAAPSRRSSIGFTRGRTNELGRVITRGNPLRKSDYNTRVVCGLEKKVVTFSFFFFSS